LSEDLLGHPILLHSLQVTQLTYPLPLYPFYCISPLLNSSSSRFALLFHSSYLPCIFRTIINSIYDFSYKTFKK
jgi:hypothetical protein